MYTHMYLVNAYTLNFVLTSVWLSSQELAMLEYFENFDSRCNSRIILK